MNKKFTILAFFLSLGFLLPSQVLAGACDTGDSIREERKIHGPANIRDKPGGKVVASLPMGFQVLALKNMPFNNSKEKESYWFFIQWKKGGKTLQGWTHENNIICD